jgi:hypothetical protein
MKTLVLSLAFGLLTSAVWAGDACCPAACDPTCVTACEPDCGPACHKGCCDGVRCPKCGGKMVCKLVPVEKEIKKVVWNVKCDQICTSLPRLCDPGCCDCGQAADCGGSACGKCRNCCDPCAIEHAKQWLAPKCGHVKNIKKLEKKEVVCKVQCYECVPACPCCEGTCGTGCGVEGIAPAVDHGAPTTAPAPEPNLPPIAPPPRTTRLAPLPPVIGTSYTTR